MLQVEQIISSKAPGFLDKSPIITKPTLSLLKRLFHENEVNQFLEQNGHCIGFEFIDRVLDHFNFGYRASQVDRRNIPAVGRTLIVANHPLGALDGLAILRLIGEIRPDVKIVANDLLLGFDALKGLVLPVDNIGGKTGRQQLKAIMDCLHREECVIIFPAGEVSRLSPSGVKDLKWNSSYLKIAQKTNSPILPVHIGGRNSMMFYTSSWVYRPLSTVQLANEMFRQRNRRIPIQVGEPIPIQELAKLPLSNKEKNKLVKRHLYRIAKGRKPLLKTEKTISHPQNRQQLKLELKRAEHLGSTKDNKQIYLVDYEHESSLMQEIGRLREIAFRKVGEGTGEQKDLDKYDQYYRHLVLWDEDELEIVGAYRIGEVYRYLKAGQDKGIYSSTLFNYSCDMEPYFEQGIELGRSFVQPKYWGKRSLDYLWYGIGAYLIKHPEVRYMFGPVSLSGHFPPLAKDMIVHFYRTYFADPEHLATSFTRYTIQPEHKDLLKSYFSGESYEEDFRSLKEQLGNIGAAVPTLFKQYSELCEDNGVRFLDFGVDASFGYCVDGLVLVDLNKVKDSKRKRYLTGNDVAHESL